MIKFQGMFHVKQYRKGKEIAAISFPNGVTNGGKDNALNVLFGNSAQTATWYIGLIDNAGFTALAAADTHASHGGWTEFQAYDEAVRQTWVEGAAASQSMTNAAPAVFTANATGVVKGMFLASINTKGSVAVAFLWATGAFGSVLNVVDNDVINVTYTINAV